MTSIKSCFIIIPLDCHAILAFALHEASTFHWFDVADLLFNILKNRLTKHNFIFCISTQVRGKGGPWTFHLVGFALAVS